MTFHALLEAHAALRTSGEPYLIATVVGVRGSTYRRPGARMLVTRDRWVAGSVSGGCLEGDIVHKGFWRIANGQPTVVTYDSRDGEDAIGCNGVVDILFEPAPTGELDPLALLAAARERQTRVALATVIRGRAPIGSRIACIGSDPVIGRLPDPALHAFACEALRSAATTHVLAIGDHELLVEVITPPPRLFVFGAGHDAVPVVQQARAIGWDVLVCVPHARPMVRERFAGATGFVFGDVVPMIDASHRALAVVMNHHIDHDRESLAALIGSTAQYIGVLGPKHRTARLLDEIGIAADARLHAPVGLALGAETPEEIALAIVAEVQKVLAKASAAHLREHVGPIHPEEVHDDDRWRRSRSG